MTVTDGKLTIEPTGGDNTKLSFVEIYELELFGPDAPTGLTGNSRGGRGVRRPGLGGRRRCIGLQRLPQRRLARADHGYTAQRIAADRDVVHRRRDRGRGSYYYAVVAHGDGLPASAPSNEVKVDVPAEPVAPATPTNVTATADDDSIVIAWDAVEGAVGYKVYRDTDADGAHDRRSAQRRAPR